MSGSRRLGKENYMKKKDLDRLSRRERQIMDIIYRQNEATVTEVHRSIPDPPSYSAVRALMGILEEKGLVKHKKRGRAYLYRPTISQNQARDSALKHVMRIFFDGSVAGVVASLVDLSDKNLSDDEFERLEKLVQDKRKQRKQK